MTGGWDQGFDFKISSKRSLTNTNGMACTYLQHGKEPCLSPRTFLSMNEELQQPLADRKTRLLQSAAKQTLGSTDWISIE